MSENAVAASMATMAPMVRFTALLSAWLATAWALTTWWSPWAAASGILLLSLLLTLFATPAEQPQAIIPVPGTVTIAILLTELAAGVASAWASWPVWAAVASTALTATCLVTERGRWQRLLEP